MSSPTWRPTISARSFAGDPAFEPAFVMAGGTNWSVADACGCRTKTEVAATGPGPGRSRSPGTDASRIAGSSAVAPPPRTTCIPCTRTGRTSARRGVEAAAGDVIARLLRQVASAEAQTGDVLGAHLPPRTRVVLGEPRARPRRPCLRPALLAEAASGTSSHLRTRSPAPVPCLQRCLFCPRSRQPSALQDPSVFDLGPPGGPGGGRDRGPAGPPAGCPGHDPESTADDLAGHGRLEEIVGLIHASAPAAAPVDAPEPPGRPARPGRIVGCAGHGSDDPFAVRSHPGTHDPVAGRPGAFRG